MNINLSSLVEQALGDDVISKISAGLGEDPRKIQGAVKAAVPSLLAGIMKQAGTPTGLQQLSQALDQTDSKMLDNLGGMLGGGAGLQDLIKKGSAMLPNILGGGNVLGGITDTLTKSAGLGKNTIISLLGMLLPIILSVLGKQKKALGLDMAGLGSLLGGQKNFLANALPAGMSDIMGLAGGLGQAVSSGANAMNGAAHQAVDTGGGFSRAILPLVALAALAYLGYKYLGPKATETTKEATKSIVDASATAADAAKSTLSNVTAAFDSALKGLADGLPQTFNGLTDTLNGIKDVDTAKAALPNLQSAADTITKLAGGMGSMPDAIKKTLGERAAGFLPTLEAKAKELLGNADISSVLKGVLDTILEQLKKLIG
ncbi:MAG: DUF937 domain-containing protein [Phycisphaerae bacterium]|nr:DUF937 domain-containing protein [Phycisphaerae bacterium]